VKQLNNLTAIDAFSCHGGNAHDCGANGLKADSLLWHGFL